MLDGPVVGVVDSGCGPDQQIAVIGARAFHLDDAGVRSGATAADRVGHGSAIAAIIRHLAPRSRLLVAQVFHQRFTTTPAQVAAAVEWLMAARVDVINLSLGLRADRPALAAACGAAVRAGVVVCAATPARGEAVWPAAYPGVVRVSGDARCERNQWSWLATRQADFGAHVAPLPGFAVSSGASMGCAHMSGHVARLLGEGVAREQGALVQALVAQAAFQGPERRGVAT